MLQAAPAASAQLAIEAIAESDRFYLRRYDSYAFPGLMQR